MFWLALAALLLALAVAALRSESPPARAGWGLALATLLTVALTARFGPRFLVLVAPILGLSWRWLRARAVRSSAAGPFDAPTRREPMTREQALRTLGLREGVSAAEISAAHRSLIKKLHPDHGGSDYLTQQVNEAKRVLQSDV